ALLLGSSMVSATAQHSAAKRRYFSRDTTWSHSKMKRPDFRWEPAAPQTGKKDVVWFPSLPTQAYALAVYESCRNDGSPRRSHAARNAALASSRLSATHRSRPCTAARRISAALPAVG